MKTKFNTVRLLFATALLGAFASFAYAGPGPQYWEIQTREAQFRALKAGEKIAYVCNQCKTVSEMPIKSTEHAMELCKEGASVMCPACTKKTKIVMKSQRNDPPTQTVVTYVNEKGEECVVDHH